MFEVLVPTSLFREKNIIKLSLRYSTKGTMKTIFLIQLRIGVNTLIILILRIENRSLN